MEKITRRHALKAIPACSLAAIVPTVAIDADPLAETIEAYRRGLAELTAIPEGVLTKDNEDAFYEATVGSDLRRLQDDTPEATSIRGVAEAIRFAFETDSLIDDAAEKVLASALAYLDGEMMS